MEEWLWAFVGIMALIMVALFMKIYILQKKYSDGDLKIVLSENGKITFSNRASGLDEIQVGRLFDRFYTVESARKSTGLVSISFSRNDQI